MTSIALWIPPDRELAQRGQIRTGWSTLAARKPNKYTVTGTDTSKLTDEELHTIRDVIYKADAQERKEQIRIGLLNLQYEQLQSNARGNGATSCVICGYDFATPKPRTTIQLHICQECTKAVCSRCKADYKISSGAVMILCRLCYDSRELWKKSGAWLTGGSLPPVVMVSKQELLRIQMSLIPSVNKRARDCPSPLLNQDEKTSDNEEEDQSFVCPRPTFRMTMQSKVEGEEGVDFGGENLSYPPFQHKTTGGMRRSKVIRRKRDRSPQGARSREESPGDDEGGGRVCVNLDINDGARLAVVSQKESRHSRENTPKIVVDAPKPDSHHRLSAPTERDYVLISAPRPASPAMGDKRGPGTDAVVGVSAGNSPEQSRGFANLVGSPPHKVLSDLVEGNESGSTTFHRRSRVLSGRPRMSRTRNTDEVGRSGSLGESDIGSTSQLCDARNPEEKLGGAESMITQGDNGGDFRKTKPLFQAAVGGAGEGTPPGSSDIAALAGGDVTMVSVGGSVAAVASALGATEEFKKVKTGPPSEADGAGVLTTGGEARTTEFRKVKVNTPSPQTITESSAPEGSQIGLGDELFRKVKVNTPSPQTITESSAPEGSQISLGDELFRKVKVNTPSPQTTTTSSAPEGSQIGLGDELFRKVKVNTPSPQSTDAGVLQTNLDEFRKVKVNSEKPANALSCQQSHDRNTEPQTQALANNLSESERTLPPQGSPPQGSPLEDSLLRNSPSEAPSESNQSSEHMPPVHKEGRRRRVIQSLHTSEEGVGTVVPQQLSDSNLQIQSHVDHVESSIGGGGGGGDGEKQATACVQPPDGTSGVQETPIATLLTASVTSEFSVHEGEEGTLQSSLQGSGARADETGEGAQSSQQGYQWRRREARRSRHIDDESELGPLPRSRVISGGSPLPRRHLKSHGNASHAKEDM